jgi:uncharacterized protein (TIGR02145 family)
VQVKSTWLRKGNSDMKLFSCMSDVYIRLLSWSIFLAAFFIPLRSDAQKVQQQKEKLFVFPAVSAGCKPQTTADTAYLLLKMKQLLGGIPNLGLGDPSDMNDPKASSLFNDTMFYDETGLLSVIDITMVDMKKTVKEMGESILSDLPGSGQVETGEAFNTIVDEMNIRKKISFNMAYNNVGQMTQLVMPRFPATGIYNMQKIDGADTLNINYDLSGRISFINEKMMMSSEWGNEVHAGTGHKKINVQYFSDTSFSCTSVSSNGRDNLPEKTVTDFIFNSKGNLILAVQKKADKFGILQLVKETSYTYYENISNPDYYALNKNFAQSFISDNPSFYPVMSQHCLKKALTRSRDAKTEVVVIGNLSFDANRNILRFIKEQESSETSSRFLSNYTYNKNCSTKPDPAPLRENIIKHPQQEVKDTDANVYHAIQVGSQTWMTEDLRVTHFRNGDSIPEITETTLWKYLPKPAYDKSNLQGYLYNWFAINDPRNIAPAGWHVATEAEWNVLIKTLGGPYLAGDRLKNISAWKQANTNIAESGFSALPAGKINSDLGLHESSERESYYWIDGLVPGNALMATSFNLQSSSSAIRVQKLAKTDGASVRCVKD